MPIIYNSTECWKIEKKNLAHNLHCYAFTCPCLFNITFSESLYNSSVLFDKLVRFDKMLSKKSLWVIFKNDIKYHATLLSEEVNTNDIEKINKYSKVLNVDGKSTSERHVHIFSRIFDSSTNKPLPRSLTPVLLSYFGDTNSANSKCIYLASIYNTLLENTAINNDIIIQPSFLKNIKINYIVPKLPMVAINKYKHYFIIIALLICTLHMHNIYKFKYYNDFKKLLYSFSSLLIIIIVVYYLYKFIIVKKLIMKATDSIGKYTDYHHDCHMSCKAMFKPNFKYNFNDELFALKDVDENKVNSESKNVNKMVTHNLIEGLKDFCNFNCGNSNIIMALNIFNNDAYDNVSFSTIALLDSLSHSYYFSDQTELDKKEFYDNINKYFIINVL